MTPSGIFVDRFGIADWDELQDTLPLRGVLLDLRGMALVSASLAKGLNV